MPRSPLPRLSALTLAIALLELSHAPALAQSAPTVRNEASLREVVISASRQEAFSDDQPLSLDVLAREELDRSQIGSIRDAAQNLPNVSVPKGPSRFAITGPANSTGRDGNSGFSIRGLGGNRVLMLVDGIRVPHSYVFGSNAFGRDYVSLDLVKRIEVLRGPSSALYGSDGLAGLVNIVTHDPADFLTSPDGQAKTIGGRLSAGWTGDNRGTTLGATVAGRLNPSAEWLLSVSGRRAHETETMGTVDTADTRRTLANPQRDIDGAVMGKLVLHPGGGDKHVITLEHVGKRSDVHLMSSQTQRPFTGTASTIAGAILDERAHSTSSRDRLTWEARYQLNTAWADQLSTVLGVQRAANQQLGWSDRNTLSDRFRDTTYNERTWQASVQARQTTQVGNGWARTFTYGLDHQNSEIRNLYTGLNPLAPEVFPLKRFPDTRESSTALYAQGEWLSERMSIVPGVRFDHFAVDVQSQDGFYPPAKLPGRSLSGSAASPKLAMLYRTTPNWSVFGQYAGGFRAPTANQVNGYYENSAEAVVIIPNPDLKPEKSRSVEFGVRGRLDSLNLDAAVFSSHFDNLIVENTFISGAGTAASPKRFQTTNTDKARIRGFELKGYQHWGTAAGGKLGTPFTFGWAKGTNSLTGAPLNSVEPTKLTVGLDFQTAQWSWQLMARHHAAKRAQDIDSAGLVKAPKIQVPVAAATTFDLTAQWRLRKDARLNIGVVNLTDRKHWLWSDVRGLDTSSTVADAYTQPGRHLNVSLQFDF